MPLNITEIGLELAKSILIDVENRIRKDRHYRHYCNKMLWVVDRDIDGRLTCVYTWDDRYAKIVTFGFRC